MWSAKGKSTHCSDVVCLVLCSIPFRHRLPLHSSPANLRRKRFPPEVLRALQLLAKQRRIGLQQAQDVEASRNSAFSVQPLMMHSGQDAISQTDFCNDEELVSLTHGVDVEVLDKRVSVEVLVFLSVVWALDPRYVLQCGYSYLSRSAACSEVTQSGARPTCGLFSMSIVTRSLRELQVAYVVLRRCLTREMTCRIDDAVLLLVNEADMRDEEECGLRRPVRCPIGSFD